MFVAVACDFSNDDHRKEISGLLVQYGFKKVQNWVFESTNANDTDLIRLKKDIDRSTDSYDVIRIYQYPMEDTLVISTLENKKWRKIKIIQ
ncbi:MAG: CRISPR-associated endonuclease Cas2 [Spirochaetales bacterium]|nr:CRISPR-associated endonuclease Cas2 [Spirochaetales bacterium]